MDSFTNKCYCEPCSNSCEPCGEAPYDCGFDIAVNPYDPSFWNVTLCGKLIKVKLPPFNETDTRHSLNYSNATFSYQAERHNETWTGTQLGSIITVGDLRDTKVDYDTDALCYELVYHKYGDCGEGCQSIEDAWSTFSIDNQGALGPQIRYVRGANRYGCPYFLDIPSNPSQYWFQGWRGDQNENGYYQAQPVATLPTNANGDPYVMSQNPVTKQPVIGTLPWNCVLENIFANLGVNIEGAWREIQGTPGFSASFDQVEGNFTINWTDWNNVTAGNIAGYGQLTGKLNWDAGFDITTGSMKYTINSVYFDHMTWQKVEGVTGPTPLTFKLWGVPIPTGPEIKIGPDIPLQQSDVNQVLDTTITYKQTILVGPGQEAGPFEFLHIYVDWIGDDEGYMGIKCKSNLSGWNVC